SLEWDQKYQEENGKQAYKINMPRKSLALLLKNARISNEASGIGNSGRTRISNEEITTVLSTDGLTSITDVKNTEARTKKPATDEFERVELFPEGRVIFIYLDVGKFLMGPAVENNFQPGIVLEAKDMDEPIQSILRAVAMGFPIIEKPSLLLYADVIPAGGVEG